jgi:prepilin-type N-terminal cleavage/methylation domain-containing protein
MKKLKALTLMEVLVAMIIGAIVITGAGFAFEIFNLRTISFKKISKETAAIQRISTLINTDLYNANSVIKKTENSFKINFTEKEINYEINPTYTLRRDKDLKDTFFLKNESVTFNFVSDTIGAETIYIRRILLNYVLDGEKEECVFIKQYGADQLMASEKKAEKGWGE